MVWTGNVDDKPSAELIGSEAAGPLLFDVLEGLAGRAPAVAPAPPDDLADVEICAYSGHIAGEACPSRIKARAPVHAVPTAPCPYHQAYDVDQASGRAVLPACRKPGRGYDRARSWCCRGSVTPGSRPHRAVPEARCSRRLRRRAGERSAGLMTPGEGGS